MTLESFGVLHPGEMGVSLAATLQNSGCRVYWASQGRGPATRRRAESCDLIDAGTLEALAQACWGSVSVVLRS